MSSTSNLTYRRTHNLLLISRLLSLRENASPFTLILDSLEQSGRPLQTEFTSHAKSAQTRTVLLSFETLRKPDTVDVLIDGNGKALSAVIAELASNSSQQTKTLLVIDSLHYLCATVPTELPAFLSSLISSTTSLLATYHTDIPLPASSISPYNPHPLTLLQYLCTTIITTHSLTHVLACKIARDRSLEAPVFGLGEGTEGVISAIGANDSRGIVIEMEYRRKSGRSVKESFFLPSSTDASGPKRKGDRVMLLEDHPLYRASEEVAGKLSQHLDGVIQSTFDLGLTAKQKSDRAGVVLPYFDAQKDGGMGEGGRILYDMGAEDDFDEEEDEI